MAFEIHEFELFADVCVCDFNSLDVNGEGWIATIEREDISEMLWGNIELCGGNPDEEWRDEREW